MMYSLFALLFLVVPLVLALGLAVFRFLFGSKGLMFAKADTLRFYLTEILAAVAWLALGKVSLILISAFGAHTLGKWLIAALGVLGFLVSLKMKFAGLTIVSLLQAFSIFANVSQDYPLDSVKFELALVTSFVGSSFLTYCLARVFKNALPQRWVYLVMLLYGILTPALVLTIMSLADVIGFFIVNSLGDRLTQFSALSFLTLVGIFLLVGFNMSKFSHFEAFLALFTLVFVYSLCFFSISELSWLIKILTNVVAFCFVTSIIWLALHLKERSVLNSGFALVMIFVLVKFYDLGYRFLDRSLFAVLAGLLFITLSLVLLKFKKYFLEKLESDETELSA